MELRKIGALLLPLLLVGLVLGAPLALTATMDGSVGVATAQEMDDDGEAGEEGEEGEEGGLEGQIEESVEDYGLPGAIAVLLVGGIILIAFVEKLISYISRSAAGLGISVFSLAIVFTGFEFDDTILALVFAGSGSEGAALGTALGTALAIVGITLALAAFVRPFSVSMPTDYLVLLVISPLILIPLVLLGTVTVIHGVILIGLFFAFLAYILWMEHERDVPIFRDFELIEDETPEDKNVEPDGGAAADRLAPITEDRLVRDLPYSKYIWLGLAIVSLVGIVAGSILIETGSEIVIEESGIDGTIFGATIITLLLTVEDIMLTLEPVRRGIPEIGIGNVIGSIVFSVTANIGFILLISDLTMGSAVLFFHLPALLILTGLGAYFIWKGQLERWHGVLLGGLYIAYWAIAVFGLGNVPISG